VQNIPTGRLERGANATSRSQVQTLSITQSLARAHTGLKRTLIVASTSSAENGKSSAPSTPVMLAVVAAVSIEAKNGASSSSESMAHQEIHGN
jgi:hypothetical protein